MSHSISPQHPAVVLRSRYVHVRALLTIAMIAVVGLTAAVVILAINDDADTSAGSARQLSALSPTGTTRYDGGPEEGSRASALSRHEPSSRHPLRRRTRGRQPRHPALECRHEPIARHPLRRRARGRHQRPLPLAPGREEVAR